MMSHNNNNHPPSLTIVAKIGGSIIEGIDPSVVEDIKTLMSASARIVLVHGGGDQVTSVAEKLGKKQNFIRSPEGITSRYTDKETAEIFTMVMSGLLSKQIVRTLQKEGINCVSLTGVDALLFRAVRKKKLIVVDDRGRKLAIDGGYTGKISNVNVDFLNLLLSAGLVPIVSPVAAGEEEVELLNVDGDRACSHIAGALRADASLFLTDMEGLILNERVVRNLTAKQAREALPSIGPGMEKKVLAAAEAVEMGSKRSIISSGLVRNPIQNALAGNGTVIS